VKGAGDVDVTCGGAPMVEAGTAVDERGEPAAELASGTLMGKRYVDEADAIELLCTKPGAGTLGVGAAPLTLKEAKPLPASD